MRIEGTGALASFANVPVGSLIILDLLRNIRVHAIKAINPEGNQPAEEYLIVLGPFPDDEPFKVPTAHPATYLRERGRHVIMLDESHVLIPSVDLHDLNFHVTAGIETIGEIVFTPEGNLLRVLFDRDRPERPAYLHLDSAKFVQPDFEAPAVATRRWKIVRRTNEREEMLLGFVAQGTQEAG